MNLNDLLFTALSFVLLPGDAQTRMSCENFKNGVNAVLEEEGKTSLQWETAQAPFKGFSSINPTMGIKAGIECNDKGELIELGASVPFGGTDRTVEPVFVRGMLLTLDPNMTPRKANDLAYMARQRLRLTGKATGSHRIPVAGYTVIFGKGASIDGGTRYRYDLKAE